MRGITGGAKMGLERLERRVWMALFVGEAALCGRFWRAGGQGNGTEGGAGRGAAVFVCAGLALALLFGACSSTSVLESRRAAGASVDLDRLHKVLVVARNTDAVSRKLAEDRMAACHRAFLVSYPVFSQAEINENENRFREGLKMRGYDGILSLRFLGKGRETRYVQGTYFPGTYQSGTPGVPASYTPGYYLPGYYREDTKTWIRVDVVSLLRNQLLWSGVTETTNASGVDKTVAEVLEEVRRQMVRDKLLTGR